MPAPETFLERIVRDKVRDLRTAMRSVSLEELADQIAEIEPPLSFELAVRNGFSLVAELKRQSPSKGELSATATPQQTALAYAAGGVSAISVLTEERHFLGSLADLTGVKQTLASSGHAIPVLRKDFILHPYQVVEARAAGADAVLLIASLLNLRALRTLIVCCESFGMCPLVEVANAREVAKALKAGARVFGINNRDLRTFKVSLKRTERLRPRIPADLAVLSLSGISTREHVRAVKGWGADGILVGESLMLAPDPAAKALELRSWAE